MVNFTAKSGCLLKFNLSNFGYEAIGFSRFSENFRLTKTRYSHMLPVKIVQDELPLEFNLFYLPSLHLGSILKSLNTS
jgi:hypothetical protein